jgi:hypothetical protein
MPDDTASAATAVIRNAQAALADIASDLVALQRRLAAISHELPVPPDQEAMLEGEIPPDVATELSGCIDLLNDDILLPALEMLRHAAAVTPHDLVHAFHIVQDKRCHEHR